MKRSSTPSRRGRHAVAGLIALAALTGGVARGEGSTPKVGPLALPPAETTPLRGVDRALSREDGGLRVRVILRPQALMAAADSPSFAELAQPDPDPEALGAARRSPDRITRAEIAAAAANEEAYEDAVATLDDESAEASADVVRVAALVERSGGEVIEREIVPAAVVARVDGDRLNELERLPSVAAIEAAPRPRPALDASVASVGAPSWWAAGFTGGEGANDQVPADAGVSSEVPDPTHPAFAGVTVDNTTAYGPDDHGTHTAGVIASQDATFRGVAYGVDRLVSGDNAFQLGITQDGIPGAEDPVESNNLSFADPAATESQGVGADSLVHIFGIGYAMAGNNDNADGSPTVGNIGRNTVSVAGYNDVDTTAPTDDVVLGISSRGPSPGGRKEPDLTAPGGSIVGPDIGWETGPDFTGETGTSFSSPHVAGAMALLEGSGIGSPIAQRALLINSARDWNGSSTGLQGWASGTQTGWRPEVGWGALDLTTALAQRTNYALDAVPEGEAAFYRASVPAGAKTTLAFEQRSIWPDFPADGSAPVLFTQSNLDLRQYTATGAEIPPPAPFDPPMTEIDPGPNAIDPNDTVEQTRTPSAQTVTFKIEAASEVDGAAAEDFALASAAPLDELEAPVTRPTGAGLSPSTTVACGRAVTVSTQLVNDSPDLDSTDSSVGLELPAGTELVSGTQTQTVSGGALEAGTTSETKSWTVQATTDGAHELTVAGLGEGLGTPFRRETQLTLTSDCVAPETALESGPGGPTNDTTPSFSFSGSGAPSSFECSLDGGAFSACDSPFTAPPLPDGAHSFSVRSRDSVGNIDTSPSTRSFEVDTQPPDTSVASGPEGPVADATPSFGLVASEPATGFECSVDASAFAPCSTPASVGPLSQGPHDFSVRAIDAAGNADATPARRSFDVDTLVSGARLRVRQRQRVGRVLVVPLRTGLAEPGRVVVRPRLRGGPGLRLKLRPMLATLSGGEPRKLVLGAPRPVDRKVVRALRDDVVELVVTARFRDVLGNPAKRKRVVELR